MSYRLATVDDQAQFRAIHAANLPHTGQIQDPVTTPAAGGRGSITSHTTVATKPCRLSLASTEERESMRAAGINADVIYAVAFEAGVAVSLSQRIVVTGTTQTPAGAVAFTHTLQVVRVGARDRADEFLRIIYATEAAP